MKYIKKLVKTVLLACIAYLAVLGWKSYADDVLNFIARKKS